MPDIVHDTKTARWAARLVQADDLIAQAKVVLAERRSTGQKLSLSDANAEHVLAFATLLACAETTEEVRRAKRFPRT